MEATGSSQSNRNYYDAFAERYEAHRGDQDPGGYHELLDEMEADFVERFGTDRDVLEVGCGTGLVLQRLSRFARSARGLDLSPGMLEKARERGLDVVEGSATALPFDSESFDVTCSFKVLAHIPDVGLALREMARVTRPGGVIIAEFYNPNSLRGVIKRWGPAGAIAPGKNERDVFVRYDSPNAVRMLVPPDCSVVATRGIRTVIPTARLMRNPLLRSLLRRAEWAVCDTRLNRVAGFWLAAMQKQE